MDLSTIELPDVTFTVEQVKAAEFAHALDTQLATEADGAALVPIGMVFFVLCRDSATIFERLGVRWDRALFGGVRLEYARQIRAGEQLVARSRFLSYRERPSAEGRLGILELETCYSTSDGQLVLREVSTLIARGGLELS
ncbi:MAG: MaoC family dehydratase N-terminal domain-containing protein [Thermogemmatispora sp.]|jgi:hypothetical protein|uniref:FAS1-like dehydratase domain-containing protein n=1 Tax=Thermogemmatispora sp. TaxID=1968838 RepID=UPI0019F5A948|nr:MaoC family dehydratase N-terminal domain-containing protein [Thermogemmatispora sp.]MBE3566784.1 MaoC family dehydratase N-terminal domain-containing protein [Thermogemmatispora sp.]